MTMRIYPTADGLPILASEVEDRLALAIAAEPYCTPERQAALRDMFLSCVRPAAEVEAARAEQERIYAAIASRIHSAA
jgi:hypothetical protein